MRERRPAVLRITAGAAAVLAGLALALVLAGLVLSARMVREIDSQVDDPALRGSLARRLLGAERLPDGYHAAWSVRVPGLGAVVLLTSDPPELIRRYGSPPERMLAFFRLRGAVTPEPGQRHLWYTPTRDPVEQLLSLPGYAIRTGERLGQGEGRSAEAAFRWLAYEGTLEHQGSLADGRLVLAEVDCPADRGGRMIVWYRADAGGAARDDPQLPPGDGSDSDGLLAVEAIGLAGVLEPLRPCAL